MKALLIILAAIALAGCDAATPTATTSHSSTGVTLAAGQGDETFYMVSDNVDRASLEPDTADIRAVTSLPNGSTKVCQFTVSQGVHWTIWTQGTAASTGLARAYCQRNGQ